MVKLFLCEDEIVMRDGIKKHINWEKEGIEFVGEAADGELAYPMILEQKPDILITDIKMPFMDGLELSELVKKELPETRIIILSGYDEFTYAQKAVSIGVEEYLLKPISPGKLKESLRSIVEKIEEERSYTESEKEWMAEEESERTEVMKHRLFESLIMHDISTSDVLDKSKVLGINLTAKAYMMTLIYIAVSGLSADSFSETKNGIRKGFYSLFTDDDRLILFDRGVDGFALLAMGDSDKTVLDRTNSTIARIRDIFKEYEDVTYFAGVGIPVNRLSEIRNTYNEANKALANRFLMDPDNVVYAYESGTGRDTHAEPGRLNIDTFIDTESPHKAIESFLRTGTMDEAIPLLDSIFATIGEQNVKSYIFLNYLTMDIYFAMARFLKEISADSGAIDRECGDINAFISQMRSADETREYLGRYLVKVVEARDGRSAKKYSRLLRNAIDYIDNNYANEDMSLNTVASSVNISPNHFSTVFSQEIGKTFIEYLTQKRMEKAKELLMTTDMRSSEIAYAVGYRDPHYFSYMFKKTQGMTSREYRSRGKEDNV